MTRVYYFGCNREPGHYWFEPGMRSTKDRLPIIDGMFCPMDSEAEGPAQLVYLTPGQYRKAWTLIAFWDRTVDGRPGSNSAFMVEGTVSFEEAVAHSRAAFPSIWSRFTFEVRQWSPLPPTPDTSKIDTPAEVGEAAKKRFDELTTGDNPYPYEWRSFYNGYLEGAFRRREESAPGEVRTGGLAEYGTTKEADHQSVSGELPGLPVEDQIRLYRASGGSVAGSEALRTKLTHSPLSTKEIV